MNRNGPTHEEIIAKMRSVGIQVDLFRDPKYKFWRCQLYKKRSKKMAYAAGTTRLSALWAATIEMVKIS